MKKLRSPHPTTPSSTKSPTSPKPSTAANWASKLHLAAAIRMAATQIKLEHDMVYRGTYKNGIVILDEPTAIAEGETVEVIPLREQPVSTDNPPNALQAALAKIAGTCPTLPKDIAENHDHYFHRTPRRLET